MTADLRGLLEPREIIAIRNALYLEWSHTANTPVTTHLNECGMLRPADDCPCGVARIVARLRETAQREPGPVTDPTAREAVHCPRCECSRHGCVNADKPTRDYHCPGIPAPEQTSCESCREWEASFDLRWRADMRAIERWRAEKPGARELRMPDHADLVVWLMGQLEKQAGDVAGWLRGHCLTYRNGQADDAHGYTCSVCRLADTWEREHPAPQVPPGLAEEDIDLLFVAAAYVRDSLQKDREDVSDALKALAARHWLREFAAPLAARIRRGDFAPHQDAGPSALEKAAGALCEAAEPFVDFYKIGPLSRLRCEALRDRLADLRAILPRRDGEGR